ncbi:DHH family phosphoesterase [Clostridium sediminicola]|uniref:DHH family phosphoesterase n=1 Tax=Clostridium sediminicola TaxID=3114879 RepID=UPI0031F1F898
MDRLNLNKYDIKSFHNPLLLKGINKALARIIKAVNEREKIVLYGSSDVDGIISTSILLLILKYLNADVEYYIPDKTSSRQFNTEFIESHVKYLGAKVIVTLGCGIDSSEEIFLCRNLGIDLIISDYRKSDILPTETMIINPNQKDCDYPFKNLCAAGISFKIAQAIAGYYHISCVTKYLDLVAIGIVSSGAVISGENKIMVDLGIEALSKSNNYGLNAIKMKLNIDKVDVGTLKVFSDVFMPKLNVLGRMDDAKIVVELLTTLDKERAERISKYLINKSKENNKKIIVFEY